MISAIEWVPQGVADPSPKKYELSATEQELVKMMENQSMGNDEDQEEEQEEEEEVVAPPKNEKEEKKEETSEVHVLPADLRMDEYSSDEDENDAVRGTALGNLLVEDDMEELEEEEPEEEELEEEEDEEQFENDSQDPARDNTDSESDSEDDLDDVPDTREYTPIDVEGLTAMGLSQVGSNAPMYMEDNDEEEDDSIADDVKLAPDDAIIVVAKTEEVSSNVVKVFLLKNRCTRVRR
jgi:hypothetical protein